jgi:hypothetical protein
MSTYRANCTEIRADAEDSGVHPTSGIDCEALRKAIWPNDVNLQGQLYRDRADAEDSGVHPTSGIDCEALRKAIWPSDVNLQVQLYSDRADAEDSGVHPTSGIGCLEKVNEKKTDSLLPLRPGRL